MTTTDLNPPSTKIDKLIVTAFKAARDSGKADWRTMKLAVLKNRLLQVSKGAFKEDAHGASSFRELLSRLPHLIQMVDDNVTLLTPDDASRPSDELDAKEIPDTAQHHDGRMRIRSDLWIAIIDFVSGKRYSWDTERRYARESQPGEELILPTMTREDMGSWRKEFVAEHTPTSALEAWSKSEGSAKALPVELRGPWNGFLKKKVAARLAEWFAANKISASVYELPRETSTKDPTVEELRKVVSACVAVMTAAELAEIRLSPTAIHRALSGGLKP